MAAQPDFILYDRHGRLAAVIEANATRGTSSRWAAEFRRNLLAYDAFRYAPFFLLVTPDRLYLWKENLKSAEPPSLIPPDHELDADPFFRPFLSRVGREDVSRASFGLIVMSWLGDLILQLPGIPWQSELEESGLLQAVKDGRIVYPAAA
jgi:hypothetical protein